MVSNTENHAPRLTVRIVYNDPPDLLQLDVHATSGRWSGSVRAYASPVALGESASALAEWSTRPEDECRIEAGVDGHGWIHLRFHTTDMAGHTACAIQLSSEGSRPE